MPSYPSILRDLIVMEADIWKLSFNFPRSLSPSDPSIFKFPLESPPRGMSLNLTLRKYLGVYPVPISSSPSVLTIRRAILEAEIIDEGHQPCYVPLSFDALVKLVNLLKEHPFPDVVLSRLNGPRLRFNIELFYGKNANTSLEAEFFSR